MCNITCPICENNQQSEEPVKVVARGIGVRPILSCNCGHRWLSLLQEDSAKVFSSYSSEYVGFQIDKTFERVATRELIRLALDKHLPSTDVLDVGCGNGQFLRIAQRQGLRPVGFDVSPDAIRVCAQSGLEAHCGDFRSFRPNRQFGLVTFWDVLEHLPSPCEFVEHAAKLMMPKATMLVKVPAFGGRNFRILRGFPSAAGYLLGAPGHMQYFTRLSLKQCLEKSGLQNVTFFPHQSFRDNKGKAGARKQIGRSLKKLVYKLTQNENIYASAEKAD
jgi:2-polyprenyl-3-methyl-5-hydroxy-6-metoxy-1,4-benzoquinol methylase